MQITRQLQKGSIIIQYIQLNLYWCFSHQAHLCVCFFMLNHGSKYFTKAVNLLEFLNMHNNHQFTWARQYSSMYSIYGLLCASMDTSTVQASVHVYCVSIMYSCSQYNTVNFAIIDACLHCAEYVICWYRIILLSYKDIKTTGHLNYVRC